MPLSGVDVALTDSGTAFTVETSTDVNGCKCAIPFSIFIDTRQQHAHVVYKFDRRAFPVMQPSSSYTMFVAIDQVALAGLQPTLSTAGSDVAVDSDGVWQRSARITQAAVTTPAFGAATYTFDFGFIQQFSLGDLIW
jgi:hypothetical protein